MKFSKKTIEKHDFLIHFFLNNIFEKQFYQQKKHKIVCAHRELFLGLLEVLADQI